MVRDIYVLNSRGQCYLYLHILIQWSSLKKKSVGHLFVKQTFVVSCTNSYALCILYMYIIPMYIRVRRIDDVLVLCLNFIITVDNVELTAP